MGRKSELPLKKVSVNLVEGDTEVLARFYPIGHLVAIRAIVHEHVKLLLETESRQETSGERPTLSAEQLGVLIGDGSDDGEHGSSAG